MKDVLIMCYEGNVRINNIPGNIKRNDVIDIARRVIMKDKNRLLADLCNVSYYVNDEIYKVYEKRFGNYEVEEGFEIRVEYEDVKDI